MVRSLLDFLGCRPLRRLVLLQRYDIGEYRTAIDALVVVDCEVTARRMCLDNGGVYGFRHLGNASSIKRVKDTAILFARVATCPIRGLARLGFASLARPWPPIGAVAAGRSRCDTGCAFRITVRGRSSNPTFCSRRIRSTVRRSGLGIFTLRALAAGFPRPGGLVARRHARGPRHGAEMPRALVS